MNSQNVNTRITSERFQGIGFFLFGQGRYKLKYILLLLLKWKLVNLVS